MSPFQKRLICLAPLILPQLVPLFFGWILILVATLVFGVWAFTIVGDWVRTRLKGKPE